MGRAFRFISSRDTGDTVYVVQGPVPDPIDRPFVNRSADSVKAGTLRLDECKKKVEELTTANVKELIVNPEMTRLKADQQVAAEKLPDKKREKKALKQELDKVHPKIAQTFKAGSEEKKPWGLLELLTCLVFLPSSIAMMGWAVVNTRNMAISSFPIFAANPEFAWGVGGVIALLALFIEMVPEFFGLKAGVKNFYHGSIGAITAVAAVVWVCLFAKSAGLLGHGGGISVDLESILAPEATFLGLAPEQQDLLLTSSQFCLEFLLPALGLAYLYQIVKAHGRNPPLVRLEENPEYQKIIQEIEKISLEISELKKQLKAPARFERQVNNIIRQYVLRAESYLLECCGNAAPLGSKH